MSAAVRRVPIFQLDAFARRPFEGNPAAVCVLERWPSDETLQRVAAEQNLSETAFLVREGPRYRIRWFTPRVEVDLCGHATLASAWVVLHHFEPAWPSVELESRSGPLFVLRDGARLVLDFPARPAGPLPAPDDLVHAMGGPRPGSSAASTRDWLLVYASEAEVRRLAPDPRALSRAAPRGGVIATAPGDEVDFVSRFFAPAVGVDEDPVTGSAHTVLVPYWSRRLARTTLRARQVSPRGGDLWLEDRGSRVRIGGYVVPWLEGTIALPEEGVSNDADPAEAPHLRGP